MSNVQLLRYRLLSAAYISEVPTHEINALQDLYVSTNGDSWEWVDTGYQWNFTDPYPCSDSWQGVTCSTDTYDGLLHIFELELSAYSLSGTLPASISNLTELRTLNLGENELSGKIPDAIGNFSHVTSLVLGSNQLTGTIPATVGYCTQLSLLVLDVNLLTGSIPESTGKCTNLTLLYLGENYLTGSIPDSIGQCTQLTGLYLDSNLLTGALPDSIGQCTALTIVDLFTNLLSGTLPASVRQCTQLTHLYVDFNRLTGTLPSSLSMCTVLSVLALNDNHLSGTLPSTLPTAQPRNSFVFARIRRQFQACKPLHPTCSQPTSGPKADQCLLVSHCFLHLDRAFCCFATQDGPAAALALRRTIYLRECCVPSSWKPARKTGAVQHWH
jgi:Leucine-rich repeat (LRR) protein